MNLHVVAYPQLADTDLEMIQACRKEHNSLYSIIGAHFTIVFSVPDMPYDVFAGEINKQAADITAIDFCIRGAAINKDAISGHYDAFLVPDEGYSAIMKLHDRLYSDILVPYHRLDIPYVPHISIASSADPLKIKQLVAEWNEKDLAITGRIAHLDIINYENRVITTIERIPLA